MTQIDSTTYYDAENQVQRFHATPETLQMCQIAFMQIETQEFLASRQPADDEV